MATIKKKIKYVTKVKTKGKALTRKEVLAQKRNGRPPNCGRCKKPKTQCKCGRPPVVTPAVLVELKSAFAYGFTDREACLHAGISTAAFYEYCKENPEFAEQKELLKDSPTMAARKVVVDEIRKKGNKKNISLAQWWLERKKRDEFATLSEISGPQGESIAALFGRVDDRRKLDHGNAKRGKRRTA